MTRWLRDILWFCLVLIAGLCWYIHSFFMCPGLPKLAADYSVAKAKNESYANQMDKRRKELEKDMEDRKHANKVEWASIPRLRNERKRLERLEAQISKVGKSSD